MFVSHWVHPVLIMLAILGFLFAAINFDQLKRYLIGRPMRTKELESTHTRLFWFIGLLVLAADLYSSVAYGPEAGVTELAHLGADARWIIIPITVSTIILLTLLIISYIMGVKAYPSGGGAYAIAKDNFKSPIASLVASSSLLIDYVLTVAVSVTAGVQAISSAYPAVTPHETSISVFCVLLILLVNLRGVSESATFFAWPTLAFMFAMLLLILTGFWNEFQHGFVQPTTPPFGTFPQGLTTLLILKAFSSACSALTGIETISNSVPVFRDPPEKNAVRSYIALGLVTAVTLLGYAYHLYIQGIPVDPNNTMLSQLASRYFDHGIIYQYIIWTTFIVLIVAANSTFTGFPQLAALVAADGFLPRSLTIRGDRLGYSNGMIVLAAMAVLLIEAFQAQTNALIPLYAVGVFVSFTIAQLGLSRRWIRTKEGNWRTKLAINAFGAVVTAIVALIFAVTKFVDGAWIVLIVLPLLIFFAIAIRRHYRHVGDQLSITLEEFHPEAHHVTTIVLMSGIHRVVLTTISFAKSINTDVLALYVGFSDEDIASMEAKWEEIGTPCRLVAIKNEYRSLLNPVARFIKHMEKIEGESNNIQLIIPQFIPRKWWHYILHNQTALLLRAWFFRHKEVVITTVPYHLKK